LNSVSDEEDLVAVSPPPKKRGRQARKRHSESTTPEDTTDFDSPGDSSEMDHPSEDYAPRAAAMGDQREPKRRKYEAGARDYRGGTGKDSTTLPLRMSTRDREKITSIFAGDPASDIDEPSVLTKSSGEESQMHALHKMIEQILSSRKEKKARRKRKVVDSFESKLQVDAQRLKGYFGKATEEALEFCSDVHSDVTKEFDAINANMKRCINKFTSELEGISRGYYKFLASIKERERLVDSFAEDKISHARDLVKKAKTRAEILRAKTKEKLDELNQKKDSIPQISSLLNTLLMEE